MSGEMKHEPFDLDGSLCHDTYCSGSCGRPLCEACFVPSLSSTCPAAGSASDEKEKTETPSTPLYARIAKRKTDYVHENGGCQLALVGRGYKPGEVVEDDDAARSQRAHERAERLQEQKELAVLALWVLGVVFLFGFLFGFCGAKIL